MSDTTKVTLSDGELAIAADMGLILTKRKIINTAAMLFNSQLPAINAIFANKLQQFDTLKTCNPKITKGENYNGFPYVIMDYPASFEKDNIFALRTMFWWGNFFSITLQLSGKYKQAFEQNILKGEAVDAGLYLAVSDSEWQHHFEEDNYLPISKVPNELLASIHKKHFIKIALKYELHHWNMMQTVLPNGYEIIKKRLFD
jgi:hypothetical protein